MIVIEYRFTNKQPLIIKDENTGSSNQLDTLRFIPGSSVRGFVIGRMDKKLFSENKREILTDTIFMNAYPIINPEISVPSPKNYYATKEKPHSLSSVVDDDMDISQGMKRASLGNFCTLYKNEKNESSITYTSIKLDETMNNNVGDKEIFRSRYICAGQEFGGYITAENRELADKIADILSGNDIYLGGYISHGFGRCKGSAEIIDEKPYMGLRIKEPAKSMKMLLLSDMCMVDKYGEPCGIDTDYLEERFGKFNIIKAASSVKNTGGRNRTWGCGIPSCNMYEKGSVFLIEFDKTPDKNILESIQDKGLGIRRNEGFGQVVFTDLLTANAESCESKTVAVNDDDKKESLGKEDKDMLKALAGKYYGNIIRKKIVEYIVGTDMGKFYGKLSPSQVGVMRTMAEELKFTPEKGKAAFDEFYAGKNEKKEGIKHKYNDVKEHTDKIFEWQKFLVLIEVKEKTIFGLGTEKLLSEREKSLLQLELIEKEMQYFHRGKEEQ